MKKIVIISLLILCYSSLSAQYVVKPNHRFGVALDAGLSQLYLGSTLNPATNFSTPSLGWFGGGELTYEMEYKRLLARIALETDYSRNWNLFNPPSQSRAILEYPTMTYQYDFSNFRQRTSYLDLRIPLMVGAEYKSLYFLVGTKLGICSSMSSTQSYTDVHIWGVDEDVINPMEDLYTHDMGDFSFAGNEQKVDLNNFSATASLEIGFCFGKQSSKIDERASNAENYRELHRKWTFAECTHYKLALFADYGLTDMYRYQPNAVAYQTSDGFSSEGGLIDIPQTSTVSPNSIFGYEPHKDAILHNLFVGLRFAFMYQIPHQPPTSGYMATPHIIVTVSDGITGEPISGAEVQMRGYNSKFSKPKITTQITDEEFDNVDFACPPGKYDFSVSCPRYITFDTVRFHHGDEFDTLNVRLVPPVGIPVNVIDGLTGESINSQMTVYDRNGNVVKNIFLDSGMVDTTTLGTEPFYRYCVTSEGYYDTCCIINRDITKLTIAMTPKPPRKFILKAMYFATDSTTVLPSSEKSLNKLYTFLSDNPDVRIRIIGHTDDVASDEYNQRLSEGRSKSVKAEMIRRGIDANRIETIGRGESDPIVPNDSGNHRQMNRRVEIELLSGDIQVETLRETFFD